MQQSKILYLTQFPHIGGGETILLSLIKSLDRRHFKPIVILPQKGQLSQKLKSLKINTYYLKLNPYLARTFFVPGASPFDLYHLIRLLQKIKPDLIHSNHLTLAIYAGSVAKLLNLPVVATAHGPWDSIYFYQDLITNLFVDKILANTPQTAQSLTRRKIISRSKVNIVPFGIDTSLFKPVYPAPNGARATSYQKQETRKALNLPQNDLVITIVGRLDQQKDHLTFLKAARIVEKKVKNALFLIVGSKLGDFSATKNSYYLQVKNYLKDNPDLKKRIRFTGFVNPDLMPQVYQASDILVSTSPSESFGLALAEGAACGLPTVATSSKNSHLIVKDGQNGFLVPPKSPDLLAQKILTLATNLRLRQKFGKFARSHIIKNFTLERYNKQVQDQYLELLAFD
ncbi:glycosyltransferase family 4 protein [Candidatus Curtissbacteria bacterium]|nr:glycosyltransferase family 4 protein [Candidatus Curtissbacteria bacterium]